MDQVNIHTTPPADPPPRPPSRWPLYAFIAIVAIVVIAAVAIAALRHSPPQAAPHATATPTAISRATLTAAGTTPRPSATPRTGPTATPVSALAATATPAAGTTTPTAVGTGTSTPTAAPTVTARPPSNPTALRVASGSCTVHHITWTWSGAQRATSYNVAVYNPQTGATVTSATTTSPRYTLAAGPGATVALKVQSRNAAGAAPNYFTPGSVGRVPPQTTNPISMTNATSGQTLTWFWTGARHATAYDIVLYHYNGSRAKKDITARTRQAHWATAVTPGVAYYLKVRSVGACAPTTFYSPAKPATAGATPTPGP